MASFTQHLEENDIFKYSAYSGSVAHPNGCIYGIPYFASRVIEFNPSTHTTGLVGAALDYGGSMKWSGGTVGSDGCIYGCPYKAFHILRYDPRTEISKLVGDPVLVAGYGSFRYSSAVSVPETESIYFICDHADKILQYNITDGTTTLFGDTFHGASKWKGACLSKVDGCIYCVPSSHKRVLKINPVDGSTTLIGDVYDGFKKWSGCVEAPDGCIYCAPNNASNFLKIDVRAGTTSLVGEVKQPRGGDGWNGCVSSFIHGQMYIFVVPVRADRMLMFDTTSETSHEVGSAIRGDYFQPAISSIDGNIYAIPDDNSISILKVDLSQLQSIHGAIQVQGMPWAMLQSIAESNIAALEQGDSSTALLPFMKAAEKRDENDEVGSLASLTHVYQLLSLKPAVMNHYVADS